MRAIIATDFCGELRKVVWLTENKTGISAGICEGVPDPHATYHANGRYHHRVRSKGRLLTIAPEMRPPLRSISTKAQLFGTAAFYDDAIMKRLPVFTPNRRVDALLVIRQSVLRDIACASFNIWYCTAVTKRSLSEKRIPTMRTHPSWSSPLISLGFTFSLIISSVSLYTNARKAPHLTSRWSQPLAVVMKSRRMNYEG